MTTYAYPISLYEYVFDELERLLEGECEQLEKAGFKRYNPETQRPMGVVAEILEIMKDARKGATQNGQLRALTITFTLTDYLFIPLENILKDRCKKYKDQTGGDPFNPITGEAQCGYASMLEGMRLAIKNMSLNSYSSFAEDEPIVLWSPKRTAKD